ncbi:reverse transcriptase domain-containing protein [Tanacetum coccineum]|uniref:Reverse transcriptase domain-containing protein n=1 Tax=Tanacetum coccineum TaxID=301880 RepID=A0ABQ5A0N3_9ASTR
MLKASVKVKARERIKVISQSLKNPKPYAKEHSAKDDTYHHCKEVGHYKRNCPAYLTELIKKKKKQVGTTSSSSIFTIELFSFPNKSWVYDTGCVEAIGSDDLVLPNVLEPYEDLDDKEEDSEEDPEMDLDEEEEDLEIDVDDKEEEEPLLASPPPLSPLRTPPPVSESSFDSDIPVTTTTTMGRPFKGPLSTYEVGEPSSIAYASVFSARYELNQLRQDFGILGSLMNRDRIEKTQDQDVNQIRELRHRLTSAEIRLEVASVDRIMPPKRMSNTDIERMIADRVDAAIAAERTPATAKAAAAAAAAETTRAATTAGGAGGSNNLGPAAGAGGPNVVGPTVGVVAMNAVPKVGGCSYKEFMNCEPTNFKGTEGAVRLTRWFERSESVF